MFDPACSLAEFDNEIFISIEKEKKRQEDHIELIASENYVSPQVLEAQGSVLTNKYAEGYPSKRYYGGCQYVDEVESIAIARAKKLFGAHYVNVQPHSGSQANAAVYLALMQAGDTLLGMGLDGGGHLTHGAPVNFSGKIYHALQYGVDSETGLIDYSEVSRIAHAHRPKVIVGGFSAYSRIIDWQQLRDIADSVGAYLVADISHVAGLIATGLYPSPLSIADVTTTTTHKTLRGPRGGMIMAKENPEIEKKLNSAVFPGLQGGPLMHIIAAKAVAFKEALSPNFKIYQQQILTNAQAMVRIFQKRGLDIVSNGTENHLFLINLSNKNITGKDAETTLDRIHITVNKNTVPNEQRTPFITSGLRLGTPAVTTRGFKSAEVETLAEWISDVLENMENEHVLKEIHQKVLALCHEFPVYCLEEK